MSMRMGYECECESENVYECEPNTRTDPCRGCQVHSFVSRSSVYICMCVCVCVSVYVCVCETRTVPCRGCLFHSLLSRSSVYICMCVCVCVCELRAPIF